MKNAAPVPTSSEMRNVMGKERSHFRRYGLMVWVGIPTGEHTNLHIIRNGKFDGSESENRRIRLRQERNSIPLCLIDDLSVSMKQLCDRHSRLSYGFLEQRCRSVTSVTLRWMTSLKRRLCK
ncbi:hypothetical protein TNCV_1274271 [Trichonephila clavipes]|nr:hypothetical protein TNCV_1274271 [Trichonephila clavipes]